MASDRGDVALAHDYLLVMRGAERTFAALAGCFPAAPVYTTVYSPEGTEGAFADRPVHTSPLQRLRPSQAHFRRLLPAYPWAVGRLPTDRFPLVVSSSSAFAIGARKGEGARHVCYCHTPFRYAWHERQRALAEAPPGLRPALAAWLARQRRWDVARAREVDLFVANSEVTRERIARCYGRDAAVVHPPVEVERFAPATPGGTLLVVSELVAHKRVELGLRAARLAGAKVRVVGGGPELERLRTSYADVAVFLGRIPDRELADEYARAAALVVTAPEEFGIVAVEAQAAGRPVLAFDVGGVRETVEPGETGERVADGDVAAMAEAMRSVDWHGFAPERAVASAARFSTSRFQKRMRELILAGGGI